MRRAGVSKPCVWRWQERFMREGVAGLLIGFLAASWSHGQFPCPTKLAIQFCWIVLNCIC